MMSSIFLNSIEPGSTAYNPQLACTLTRRQASVGPGHGKSSTAVASL